MREHLREEEFIPYLDGRVSEAERRRLDDHLAACADCRTHLYELRALMGVLADWTAAEPSAGFDAALRARFAEEANRPQPWYAVRPAYAVALAAAVVAALGLTLWQPAPPEANPPSVAQTQPPVTVAPAPAPLTQATPAQPAVSDDLAVLENPVLLENYELLDEFDVLFEPLAEEKKSL